MPLAADLFDLLENNYGWQSLQVGAFATTLQLYANRMQQQRALEFVSEGLEDVRTDRLNGVATSYDVRAAKRRALSLFDNSSAVGDSNDFSEYFPGVSADGRSPAMYIDEEALAIKEGVDEEHGILGRPARVALYQLQVRVGIEWACPRLGSNTRSARDRG